MRLTSENILVQPITPEASINGIFLPDIVRDDINTGGPKLFRVLALGPGRRLNAYERSVMHCEPGDRVIAQSYYAGPIDLPDGTKILPQKMILVVLPKTPIQQTL